MRREIRIWNIEEKEPCDGGVELSTQDLNKTNIMLTSKLCSIDIPVVMSTSSTISWFLNTIHHCQEPGTAERNGWP